jgi:hypothetical protein
MNKYCHCCFPNTKPNRIRSSEISFERDHKPNTKRLGGEGSLFCFNKTPKQHSRDAHAHSTAPQIRTSNQTQKTARANVIWCSNFARERRRTLWFFSHLFASPPFVRMTVLFSFGFGFFRSQCPDDGELGGCTRFATSLVRSNRLGRSRCCRHTNERAQTCHDFLVVAFRLFVFRSGRSSTPRHSARRRRVASMGCSVVSLDVRVVGSIRAQKLASRCNAIFFFWIFVFRSVQFFFSRLLASSFVSRQRCATNARHG